MVALLEIVSGGSSPPAASCRRAQPLDSRVMEPVDQPNRFVNDLTRTEVLKELRSLRDDDGLDHTAELDGCEIEDPTALDDETLRELLKVARLKALLWRQLDE